MKFSILISISALLVCASPVSAETQFIKYKKYLIPISSGVDTTSPQCVGLSASQKNVIYIDDLGELDQDPNGFQDLAIVLGLSDKVNLLVVGVGVPGKKEGLLYSNIASSSITVTQRLVNASNIVNKPSVMSGNTLRNKIIDYAKCSSSSNKLILAIGGLWNDVSYVLDHDESIKSNIKVIGITGSNINPPNDRIHTTLNSSTKPEDAYNQVKSLVSEIIEIGDPEFRGLFSLGSGSTIGSLNNFFSNNFATLLHKVIDTDGNRLDSQNPYKNELVRINNGHHLRIADFGTVALATELWPRADIYNKAKMYPVIIDALEYATTGN